jgi:hypothetical protein
MNEYLATAIIFGFLVVAATLTVIDLVYRLRRGETG